MPATSTESRNSIVALLWAFAFLSYLLRINITIAQQDIVKEFALSTAQVGAIFSAFLIGYTLFQFPAGMLGDRLGPRFVLGLACFWGAITTVLTGLLPGKLWPGLISALSILLVVRFLNGIGQAAVYPVAMSAVALWFPPRQHAFVNSLIFTGSTLGSACAPPLVAYVMTRFGWRATFYLTSLLPVLAAVLWYAKTKKLELAVPRKLSHRQPNWWRIFTERNVFFLCLSYFLYCYSISIFVYWLFKYLVDVRHLSVMNSGWVNSLPWLAATVLVPIAGRFTMTLSDRLGFLNSRRVVAVLCLLIASVLLYFGARSASIAVSIAAIAASVALLFSTETCYFSTAIAIAGSRAGAASGLMNLAGNLGSVAATSAVPLLVQHYGWIVALLSGSAIATLAALVWFGIASKADLSPRPIIGT